MNYSKKKHAFWVISFVTALSFFAINAFGAGDPPGNKPADSSSTIKVGVSGDSAKDGSLNKRCNNCHNKNMSGKLQTEKCKNTGATTKKPLPK